MYICTYVSAHSDTGMREQSVVFTRWWWWWRDDHHHGRRDGTLKRVGVVSLSDRSIRADSSVVIALEASVLTATNQHITYILNLFAGSNKNEHRLLWMKSHGRQQRAQEQLAPTYTSAVRIDGNKKMTKKKIIIKKKELTTDPVYVRSSHRHTSLRTRQRFSNLHCRVSHYRLSKIWFNLTILVKKTFIP